MTNRYLVSFRDFLHNRISFDMFVNAKDMKDAVRVARQNITMPKYVICDYVQRVDA